MSHVQHLSESGLPIPSVSEIPGLFAQDLSGFEDWICRSLHEKEAKCCIRAKREFYQDSADLGNDIHTLREAFLKGESFNKGIPEYHAGVFDPIARFYKESGYEPLYIEEKMTGKEFGGTLDGAGTFKDHSFFMGRRQFWASPPPEPVQPGDVWIEDLKIKSKLDPLHPLQLYGYSLLLKEVYGIEAKWGLIIRREKKLDKKPEIQLKGYYLPAYKKAWDSSVFMWHFLND
jgi:hypothetical protein